MTIRFSLSAIAGVIVTLALFYLMQSLISGADSALTDDKIGNLVDFVRVKQEQLMAKHPDEWDHVGEYTWTWNPLTPGDPFYKFVPAK